MPSEELAPLVRDGQIRATTDYNEIRRADAILIALPTPLSKQREPDLSIVISAAEQISVRLRNGHLVVLESTTYPRTTREVIQPILESTGLKAGRDFHLAFSPERVDPGNGTLDDQERPEDRRRDHARSAPSAPPSSTREPSTPSTASRRRRRPS